MQLDKRGPVPAPACHKERGPPETPMLQTLLEMKELIVQLETLRVARSDGKGSEEALLEGLSPAIPALTTFVYFWALCWI